MELPLTPLEFARRARRLYPEREAVVDGDLRLTYREFFERCDRWSAALQKLGVRPGDRVAYIAPNTHAQLESFYAVPQIGAVVVPINYRLTPADFTYLIQHSGAKVVCAHSDYLDAVDSIRGELPDVQAFVALESPRAGWLDYEALLAASPATFDRPEIRETDLITINYTSGTTSRPKGVMITHRNAYMNAVGTLVHHPMSCADRYLWTLPMFHANGWCTTWGVTAVGATHVCLRAVRGAEIWRLVDAEEITHLNGAPTVLTTIAAAPEAAPLKRPLTITTAGAPPSPTILSELDQLGARTVHVYGLTETYGPVSVCELQPGWEALDGAERARLLSRQGVGMLIAESLRVVDEQMNDVPADGETMGEIVMRGNSTMVGYFDDEAATAKAFAGGWFHSGDLGVMHADGYVELRDRAKDIIISGGENISTVEVEQAVVSHEAVLEAAIIGVPDPKWGERPKAFVVLRPGASVSEQDLIAHVCAKIARYKAPAAVAFMEDLPKTSTGKVQKFELREREWAGHETRIQG